MTMPAGVSLATVTFGKALGALGTEATISATVALDRPLVWAATGESFYAIPDPVTGGAGGFLTFQVPHVDQPGFIDAAGNAVTDFAYVLTAEVKFAKQGTIHVSKAFQVRMGQASVDLDLVPGGSITPGVTAPGPSVLSVAGLTGTVTLADLQGLLNIPDPAALSAAFAPGPVVPPPAGFGFTTLALPRVHRLGGGRFTADLDAQALRPPAGVTYYASLTGVDTNTGLTPAAPITLAAAFGKADVGTIVCTPGEYFRDQVTPQINKSINLLAAGPGVKLTGWNNPGSTVWTLVSGSVYTTSRSATAQVVDVTNRTTWGDYTAYVKKPDLASVTGPGQWAIVGSNVYVWAIGNTDLRVAANRYQLRLGLSGTFTGLNTTGGAHYARGINFEGQSFGTAIAGGSLFVAEDCTFRYSLVDGLAVSGAQPVLIRCEASSNALDGFSYADGVTAANAIEIDCRAHHNGLAAPGTNNATTSHGTSRVFRVGGSYDLSGGPLMADVNSARSWNLGCTFGGSTAPDAQNHSVRADATGYEATPAEIWLDECTLLGATYGIKVTGGGKVHLHGTQVRNPQSYDTSGVGVIDYYTPAA